MYRAKGICWNLDGIFDLWILNRCDLHLMIIQKYDHDFDYMIIVEDGWKEKMIPYSASRSLVLCAQKELKSEKQSEKGSSCSCMQNFPCSPFPSFVQDILHWLGGTTTVLHALIS